MHKNAHYFVHLNGVLGNSLCEMMGSMNTTAPFFLWWKYQVKSERNDKYHSIRHRLYISKILTSNSADVIYVNNMCSTHIVYACLHLKNKREKRYFMCMGIFKFRLKQAYYYVSVWWKATLSRKVCIFFSLCFVACRGTQVAALRKQLRQMPSAAGLPFQSYSLFRTRNIKIGISEL